MNLGVGLGFRKIPHVKFLVKYLSYKAELIYRIILVVLMLVDQKVLLLLAMLTTLKKDISAPFVLVLVC